MGADPGDVDVATDSILDWMDPDSDPHVNGAENDYYQGAESTLLSPRNCAPSTI